MHTRMLAQVGLGLVAAFVLPQVHSAVSASDATPIIETVKVADRVYAFIGPDPTRDIVVGNVVAVIGDDSVLLVDSTNAPSNARTVLAELRKITDKPVRYIVHTHWHYDHIMGDTVFASAFSPLDVVAHVNTRPIMDVKIPAWPERGRSVYSKIADQYRAELASGTDEHGRPLSAVDRARHTQTIADALHYGSEFAEMGYVQPTITFSDRMTLYLGQLEVRLIYLGLGNTEGDIVVLIPELRVVATGDLLVAPIPYAFNSHIASWAHALAQLAEMDVQAIVPGHGPVLRDKEYLLTVERLLRTTAAKANEARSTGRSLEDAQKTIDLEAFRSTFTRGDDDLEEVWRDYFRDPAIASVYADPVAK